MARTVAIGIQDYAKIITEDYFYIDKTNFIKEWWEGGDVVTLITRPRRFGKTLNMNMLDYFFSIEHANRSDLFEGLSIWEEEKYRKLQGTYPMYELTLTNLEVKYMFLGMVNDWFDEAEENYSEFIYALLQGDKKAMNIYMNRMTMEIFSYFDTGKRASGVQPERFYHGFVLGLIAQLHGTYMVTSNRESGFGRYDVMIEPKDKTKDALILEFKVYDPEDEADLKETVASALQQIEEKQYEASLIAKGFPKEQIRKYGFAFEGKKVLIG